MSKRLISMCLTFAVVFSMFVIIPTTTAQALTQEQLDIVARADEIYNTTWVAQRDVEGWISDENYCKFYKGNTYRIPYGQPVQAGRYIGYGASIETFKTAANDANSIFYTQKSRNGTYTSTYYATDCSSFVSSCWNLQQKKTTSTLHQVATNLGRVNISNVNNILRVGDALNSTTVYHVVLVTDIKYSGNNVTSIEITEQTPPEMKRSNYTPEELVSKYGASYSIFRYANSTESGGSTIDGNFEGYAGGNGTVYVKGWAFDSVDTSVSTEVHVYIGGPAGEGEGHIIKANVYRSDVDDKHGCGDYHGFESTITTTKRGTQPIYVYAIGVDTNTNISLGSATVTISDAISDTSKPVVSNVKIAKTDAKSFTVSCTVKDNALSKVHMYAWYTSNKDGTQKCYNAKISGTTASYTIPIADLGGKNGNYTVHIYAYDTKENCGTGAITLDFYNPLGTLDSYSGGGGSVTLRGWAFDGNDTSKPVEMNVYIGGDAGVGEGHAFLANTSRPDVDDVHGCGDNHGFSVTLSTKKTGTQDVYVYMQNIGHGGVKLLKKVTVTISPDSAKPSVKNTKVASFDGTTFTVTANVSDNTKVEKASFAVWLDGDKDNTLKWLTGTISNGVASCKIKRSDISNKQGKFIVHVYAYDSAGNYDVGKTEYKYYTPTGSVEVIEGAENSIKIKGWVYDENNFNESVQLQVTIGSGSNKENYTITADKLRKDIDEKYGCGAYHGFEATLDTKYVGSTYVVVGAKDIDTGVATTLKIATVNVIDAPKVIIGNVNNDEGLDVNDVTYIQMFLAGYVNADGSTMIETSKEEVFKIADANGDGSLDVNDVTYIQMKLAGVIE